MVVLFWRMRGGLGAGGAGGGEAGVTTDGMADVGMLAADDTGAVDDWGAAAG